MISSRVHGILDYAEGALLIIAPYLLGFANGGPEQWVAQIVGVLTILTSLVTRYELSLAKLVPFRMHLGLDMLMGVVLIASPWLFGFADRIWWPHVLVGLTYIVVPILTDKREPLGSAADRGSR